MNQRGRTLGLALVLAGSACAAKAETGKPLAALALEPVGFATYPVPSRGAELAYFLSPTGAVALSYAAGEQAHLLEKRRSTLALLRYKQYIGASSHLNFGAGYRTFASQFEIPVGGEEAKADMTTSSLVAEVSFGNQLNFGPLSFGCDWAGVALPLSKLSAKRHFPDGADTSEQNDDEATFNRTAAAPSWQFVRVFIGAVF